jgi:hypothetical protein
MGGARLGKAHVAGKSIARNRWVGWVEKNGAGLGGWAWAKRTSRRARVWAGENDIAATGHASLASRSDTPARLLGKKWETDSL